jgi:methanethiol S-methyltransferase
MARSFYLLFGVVAYAIFFATFLYLIAFVGNLPRVPRTVDWAPTSSPGSAFVVDLGLIALFGLQHSVMARQGFKKRWTKIVPEAVERSVYVLAASLVLIVLFAMWRPIPQVIWHVDNIVGVAALWAIFALGWLVVLLSTFLLGHFELFGLKQVYLNLVGKPGGSAEFRQPLFYKIVRHPLYAGFFLAFWATPTMTLGHLLFALGMSLYVLLAIQYEERDLVELFGSDYERYRQDVGMLAPRVRRAQRGS